MLQQEIVDAMLQLRNDRRVADVRHSVDTIATILNVPTVALNKALSKVAEFAPIDLQNNNIGIVRFKKQIRNNTTAAAVNRHFLFFAHRKTPTFFTDRATWTEIYNMSAQFKLAPRSQQTRTVLISLPSE
jgi:GTP cyclohydrolase FolE2